MGLPRSLCAIALIVAPLASAAAEDAGHESIFRDGRSADCGACHRDGARNRYRFDSGESRISFSVDTLGFLTTMGSFGKFFGGFLFDPEAPEKSMVFTTIRTASVDMGDDLFDSLVRERFFDADRFPEVRFVGRRIERTGTDSASLTGDLTLHGVTRPLVLDVRFNRADRQPADGRRLAGFSAEGTIRRSEFGITAGLPVVGDEVTIRIEALGEAEG